MPLPRPLVVSTVTTEGSTCRTSAGRSAPAAVTGAVELVGAAVVLVEPELVELLHAARKMTVTASSAVCKPRAVRSTMGASAERLRLHSITSVPVTAAEHSA